MSSTATDLELLRSAFEQLPAGFMLFRSIRGPAGKIVDFEWLLVNAAAARLLGRPADELCGQRLLAMLPPEHAALVPRMIRVVETGEPDEHDFHYTQGEVDQWFANRATKVGDGFSVLFSELPERRRLALLRQERWRLVEELFMQAPFAISVVQGPEHRFVLANPEYERMTGLRDIIGKPGREVFSMLRPNSPLFSLYDEVRETGEPFRAHEYEIEIDGPSGIIRRYYQFSCTPIRDETGVVAIQSVAVDVSDQVRCRQRAEAMTAALEQSEAALREADRQKDEFLAMLSHELRNPLAAIRSACALLENVDSDHPLMPRIQDVLSRQTGHMAHLLDELLDLARVTGGELSMVASVIDLREVVREVVAALEPASGEPSLTVRLPEEPTWVEGDRTRLAQVVQNLLSNAIKYTPTDGTIEVRLTTTAEEVTLAVTDTGVGLDPELYERLFRPFQQAPQNIARSAGGLGLGLALSKSIVELHEGTISARSAGPGQGSVFEVELPLSSRAPAPTPRRAIHSARIMIIEDNEDAAELLGALLRTRGYEVELATRGDEALEILRSWRPDAIICDIGLPDIDGYTIARTIRSDPKLADIRLIALSGYGQDRDRARAAEAGFDRHLTKPAAIDAVIHALGS